MTSCWNIQEFPVLQPQIVFSATWLPVNKTRGIGQRSPDPLLLGGVWAQCSGWLYKNTDFGVCVFVKFVDEKLVVSVWIPVCYFKWCIPILTGAVVILAQFHINHFRSIAWYNVIIGIGYILLQIIMFRGESKCHCEDFCRKSKCSLPERSKLMSWSNLSLILVSLKWH